MNAAYPKTKMIHAGRDIFTNTNYIVNLGSKPLGLLTS